MSTAERKAKPTEDGGFQSRRKAVLAASLGTAVGSSAGALLPFAVAHRAGVGTVTDTYFIVVSALQLFAYLIGLVAESAALPVLSTVATLQPHSMRHALASVMRKVLPAALALNVLSLAIVSGVVLPAAGISVLDDPSARTFLIMGSPLPVLAAASGLAAGCNYALQSYAFTTSTQFLRAGVGLGLVMILPSSVALPFTVCGLTLGELLRFAFLYNRLPTPSVGTPATASSKLGAAVLRLAGPTMLSSAIIAVNPLVDKAVAAGTGAGSVTILELAEKIYYIPSVLLVAAVSKVAAAEWARKKATAPSELRGEYRRFQVASCLAALFFASSLGVVVALVSRGSWLGNMSMFDYDLQIVLTLFLAGLPWALSADLSNTMLITLRRARVMPWLAAFLVVVNVVLDIVGAARFGVAGVALASTLVRVLSCLLSMFFARRYLGEIENESAGLSVERVVP